jgi:cell wall-associated NlpC family hydrolase
MRFGCLLLLIALVTLLAVPAAGAQPTRPGVEETAIVSPQAAERPQGRPAVVTIALRYLGVPYRWSGTSPAGFDCSGFVMYVLSKVRVELPHNAALQYGLGRPVARRDLRPGDVVFFNGLSHSGIYIGRGRFVHSPQTGDTVRISRLSEGWYRTTYSGARRY